MWHSILGGACFAALLFAWFRYGGAALSLLEAP
jgi:hypothetical protein